MSRVKEMVIICIIVLCPPGKTPDVDTLVDCTYENADGSGWVIRAPHGLEIVRSAEDIDHVLGSFLQARERWPNAWAMWHSRMATHGELDDANTHPFTVPGRPWAMAHNGILPLSDGPFRRDRSDSRILAEDILSGITWAEMYADKANIESWLAGDRVVIMSERKERGGPVLILNENRGHWDKQDGCWYSRHLAWGMCAKCHLRNSRCQCRVTSTYGTYRGWDDEENEDTKADKEAYREAMAELLAEQEEKEALLEDLRDGMITQAAYNASLAAIDAGDWTGERDSYQGVGSWSR